MKKKAPVHSKHLISIHHPHLWLGAAVAGVLIICMVVWSAFQYGRSVAGFDQSDYDQQIEVLQISLNEQTARKEDALRENARLSRGSDIQKDASSQVRETLTACEEDALKMKEELTFYHNVVTPRKSKREIQVNKVVFSAGENGAYNYKVVLIQVGRHDTVQRGYVELSFNVRKADGTEVRLDLPTVSIGKAVKRQKFGFKYFQNFEGGIRFPEGSEPLSLHIKAQPKSAKVPRLNKEYAWDDLIAGGSEAHVGQEKKQIN
ncbi:MAG: hypothetical protein DIZ80_12670 [endosymbiont of Galathealinum brachiosum]|uniref:Uncharacterized protein n=1 Tax=endosymbiont of Galathealinum brachiosum TaxID=2200906 RepID=A0A370DFF7_9GAMM|nr:MAG: hypothetical protein DIZ80_12670 [endosymbiont of Galathealinum brachiosum]